jgi:hypothetical protein
VFRGKQVEQFRERKLALVLESGAHRLAFQTELQKLRSTAGRTTNALRSPRKLALPVAILVAVAGFMLTRRSTRTALKTVMWASRWALPLYRVWKKLSPSPHPRLPKG